MGVVVDTSVWSLALRRGTPPEDPQVGKFSAILNEGGDVVLLGVVLQEVLQGIRRRADFDKVRSHLEAFPLLSLERDDYVMAAELRNLCVARGINVGTIDCQIAAACVRHGHALLTRDQDFQLIASVCELRLL